MPQVHLIKNRMEQENMKTSQGEAAAAAPKLFPSKVRANASFIWNFRRFPPFPFYTYTEKESGWFVALGNERRKEKRREGREDPKVLFQKAAEEEEKEGLDPEKGGIRLDKWWLLPPLLFSSLLFGSTEGGGAKKGLKKSLRRL